MSQETKGRGMASFLLGSTGSKYMGSVRGREHHVDCTESIRNLLNCLIPHVLQNLELNFDVRILTVCIFFHISLVSYPLEHQKNNLYSSFCTMVFHIV